VQRDTAFVRTTQVCNFNAHRALESAVDTSLGRRSPRRSQSNACLFGFKALKTNLMKKLLLGSFLAAFASLTSVQAGDAATKAKAAACPEAAKSACATKSACCADKAAVAKKADTSVRGATLLVRK
jgi:hypothetical protein